MKLDLTALNYAKKFRNHGYKNGALTAFTELEEAGLGTLETDATKPGKVHDHCIQSHCIFHYFNYYISYNSTTFSRRLLFQRI